MIRVLLGLLLAIAICPAVLAAQARACNIDAPGRTEQVVTAGDTVVILHDPFVVTCEDGAELRADSGELNRRLREIHLLGDVFFQDSAQTLTSDVATYNSGIGRLWATGDVVFVDRQEGSTLEGPELEYFRATDERPVSRVTAGQRPRLTIEPAEGGEEAEPLDLVADRVEIIDQNDLSAFGSVVITRTDLRATAGEARYNSLTEDLELREAAVIESEEYDLAGEVVQARLADGSIQHVHARTNAWLQGEDLRVTAPDLQLFFEADLLQRAIAVVPAGSDEDRAVALSRTFRMEGDSLDAIFADQQIERVHAVGDAHGETIDTIQSPPLAAGDLAARDTPADSVAAAEPAARVPSSDWIRGDTITGFFALVEQETSPAPAAADLDRDTADTDESGEEDGEPRVELTRLLARGSAQSLYRMTPSERRDDPSAPKNLNFLVGDEIDLDLSDGELQVATVVGLRQGVYLEALTEPAPDGSDAEPLDPESAPATPDSEPTSPPTVEAR